MEGIFVVIILGIISSILSKLGEKEQKPMPPFGGGKHVKNLPPKEPSKQKGFSLEDFTKEIFQQFESKQEEMPKPSNRNIQQNIVTEQKDELINTELSTFSPPLQLNEMEETKSREKSKQVDMPNFVPNTKEALIQAIVTSEILGPPLSKRR